MKEKPILFSGPMVKAIVDGRKTQTRRIVKGMALEWLGPDMFTPKYVASSGNGLSHYGYSGDKLWVKETYNPGLKPEQSRADGYRGCVYRADDMSARYSGGWTPSIYMPRRHSRLTLEIVDVRIERLQSICEDDLLAEGIELVWGQLATDAFAMLWDSLNAKRGYGWGTNPWVWVVEFKKL